jgi:hypothetical protein
MRGQLTSFRPDKLEHLTPALPHVTETIMHQEKIKTERGFAGRDVIPRTRGRIWSPALATRCGGLLNRSVIVAGRRL